MNQYHKIKTVFLRNPETNYKTLLEGQFALPEFEYLKDNEWIFTEKVDGTNIRIIQNPPELKFYGKTANSQIPSFLVNKLNEIFNSLKGKITKIFPGEACLYGEGYGAKIQKGGGNYRQDQGFVLFDVKVGDWWLRREDVEDVAEKLGIDVVPIIGEGDLYEMVEIAKNGIKSRWGDFQAEGIVARPKTELKTRSGKRVITKIKCRDFRKEKEVR